MLVFYMSMIQDKPEKDKFTAIYEQHYPTMLKIANGVLQDQALAEDAVHETFLYILKILGRIGDPASLQTKVLIRKSVYHISLNLCRTSKKNQKLQQALNSEGFLPEREELTVELEQRECHTRLKQLILELPETEQELLKLYYFAKIPAEDLARLLHISKKTVYNRLHAITKKLNQQMREEDLLD